MNILIGVLTAIHILTAVVLVILVLMQKSSEQGVGAAFGGEMTETVFGGSITPLVKMTIWCAGILLATTLTLAVLQTRRAHRTDNATMLEKLKRVPATAPAAPGAPVALPATAVPSGAAPIAGTPEQIPPMPAPAAAPVGTPVPAPAK